MFAPAVTERPRFNMANVAHAFQAFLSDLELTEREREVATSQHITVRSNLQASLDGVETALLMGSFRRRTAIRPLGDIDVFAVLDPAVHAGARSRSPIELLQAVDRALRRSYPNHRPRIQGRSVNIEFTGTGIGYDIVPAFASGRARDSDGQPAEFEIPDRAQRAWIKTNPRLHVEACVQANARSGGVLNGLIKAVKAWNRTNGDLLRSFHLEVMSYGAFASKPTDPRSGLKDLFTHLSTAVMRPCPEPAGLGPTLDADVTPGERQKAHLALREAARGAATAVLSESCGDDRGACQVWRQVLGTRFGTGG